MSTNKNAVIRYLALDRCFQNPGRKYYIMDLVKACNEALFDIDPDSTGVKKRQVYEDIKFMKDSQGYNAPIESFKDGKETYFRYSDKNFSIGKQQLNQQEAYQLKEALTTLSRFIGLPQFEWIEEIKARLEHSFKLKSDEKIITFDDNPYLSGKEFIGELYNAIVNKQVLRILYKSFKMESDVSYEIHPYHLKQYNNRWFLLGWNTGYNKLTIIALDRIQSIEEGKTKYISSQINFDEYFEDVIGVSIEDGAIAHKILLKIEKSHFPYIKTKPLHGSQKIKAIEDDYVKIELELKPNFELESLILSFGEKLEVLEPASLRDKIKERVTRLSSLYF